MSALLAALREQIRAHGPLPFAAFMERALYDPHEGYYTRGPEVLGPGGDFITASDLGPLFGRAIARLLAELDRRAGPYDPFAVLEVGAGRGLLARAVLDALVGGLAARVRYEMVDRSPAMRSAAARLVPEASVGQAIEPRARRGCVLAVELFDALPVHRLRRRAGRLVEVCVGLDERGELIEVEALPTPAARELAERYGAAAAEGQEAEVAPGAAALMRTLCAALDDGLVLVVDYGDRAPALYGPSRPGGTLLAYRAHRTTARVLEQPGRQDLTAHVNFSLLEETARACGFATVAWTTQDRLLVANGLLEVFEGDDRGRPERVRERLQALELLHPHRMGRIFRVLVLGRGVASRVALEGLRDPFR